VNASKIAPLFAVLLLAACAKESPQALGTLEYDRVALPAPIAERIVSIDVREGQQVAAGARLLTLERTRTEAQTEAARAEAQRQREALGELEAGPREEQIAQARASVSAAQAASSNARVDSNAIFGAFTAKAP
jgi:HlyD family secretion protein